jgi:hypothetical protein
MKFQVCLIDILPMLASQILVGSREEMLGHLDLKAENQNPGFIRVHMNK